MSFWSRFTGGKSGSSKPQKLDYLSEALALERQGDYDAALTSYRLALRDQPSNYKVLQNMAIAYTKMGQTDQAIRCYRGALQIQPKLSGAHYGLAFLLLKQGELEGASSHLEAFLTEPPKSAEAERWIAHARETLHAIQSYDPDAPEVVDEAAEELEPEQPPATPSMLDDSSTGAQ
ncbi:MAG TPA: tetratricopeptide repeat protein [Gemmatimonadaceae bacterium]|nr:tetratricopeptide repeat protein [Gemmatimonadaceae bacterium]